MRTHIRGLLAAALVGVSALALMPGDAKAWGWGPGWGGGPWNNGWGNDGWGRGSGSGNFGFNMGGSGSGWGNNNWNNGWGGYPGYWGGPYGGYGYPGYYGGPWGGYGYPGYWGGPYGYAPPAAAPAETKKQ